MSDTRAEASAWIADHIPAGSDVVVQTYGAWVDPDRYDVTGRASLLGDNVPPGTDYIVASESMFGRYADPEKFPRQAPAYQRLFASLELVREFEVPGNAIRVYRVP